MERHTPILTNEWYHVYNRGNDRRRLFHDAKDYRAFAAKLERALVRYKVDRIAWVLMPNHFHCILRQCPGGSLPRMMNSLETSYAKRFNLGYHHTGHAFEGRYRYTHIPDEEALWSVARYVHLNPVRAKLVARPEEWEYSDFREHRNTAQGVLEPGTNSVQGRLVPESYPAFVEQGVKDIEALRR
jgi:putative transposase